MSQNHAFSISFFFHCWLLVSTFSSILKPRLYIYLIIFLYFGCLLGYISQKMLILLSNFLSALINLSVIDKKLTQDFSIRKIIEITNPIFLFISSPLGFILKHDKGLWKIRHLSYFSRKSVNNHIVNKAFILSYSLLQRIFTKVLATRKYIVLIK